MARCVRFGTLWLLMLAVGMEAKNGYAPGSGIVAECHGNIMRLMLDRNFLQGRSLKVDAVYGTDVVPITPNLASQCGFSRKSDPWGNVKLFASLQNCFSYALNDDNFNTTIRLRLIGTNASEDAVHAISAMCKHSRWAFREILCDRNYMEVSVGRKLLDIATKLPLGQKAPPKGSGSQIPEQAVSEYTMWKVLFYMPGGEKTLTVEEAFRQGYGLESTPNRLVLRASQNASEAYLTDVDGVPMHVLKTSTFFKQKWMVTLVDAAVACPAGGVSFTEDLITWTLPRIISPLLTSAAFTLLEVHMGIDGKQLDGITMASRGYVLTLTDLYITVQIPVGAQDGHFKSYAPGYQYHIAYTIEPMLELLWHEEDLHTDTRYKVLYPITTPLRPRPPHIIDNTIPQKRMFEVVLGTFLPDVQLVNITFGSLLLSVAEANAQGFAVQENSFPNGSKIFSLQVPFSDPVVLKHTTELEVKIFKLPLVFGLLILPELSPFSHPAVLEASLQDIILPTATGTCDHENFYVQVKLGSMGPNMLTMIGKTTLTTEIASGYGYKANDTHFRIAVPFRAVDAIYELVEPFSLRSRLDMTFLDPVNNKNYNEFSISCGFPVTMAECFPNGTMTVLAIKVESVPQLNPMHLTLRDPSCKPVFYNDRVAYFSFGVNTCGTTRKFTKNLMIYENVVTLPMMQSLSNASIKTSLQPLYRLQASCHYVINTTQMIAFNTRAQLNVPLGATGVGKLSVRMRLSQDASYTVFYQDTDYPVVKYLQQPLYFEVELMQSTDPLVELFLENCWATMDNRTYPKWDLIVDSCENPGDSYPTLFHPVSADARVLLPSHFKRFQMAMFSFTADGTAVKEKVIVHCDVILCDASGPQDSLCNKQCMNKQRMNRLGTSMVKRVRRSIAGKGPVKRHVSSGPVMLG
ncbi:uncharacterized protein LOC125714330 [Brienomyrus brachyistius]|uniref:uncharacterized protein LOC125714330 n=1 Tax=Brienomyrus brachyistius TaxID=42636 RepID=UPI0020B3EBDC|nr:uncharacterized protein LOC125714330 [Brienomyrus brachyistius]